MKTPLSCQKLLELIEPLQIINPDLLQAEQLIAELCLDSRLMSSGAAFFCIAGEKDDGHAHVLEAIAAGAELVIAEDGQAESLFLEVLSRPVIIVKKTRMALAKATAALYGYPSKRAQLIGVTGTNGKTTCTHLIAQLLAELKGSAALMGTMGAKIFRAGAPEPTLLAEGSGRTTPEAPELQSTLDQLIEAAVKHIAMEVSSHALHQSRVAENDFAVAVFTNLTQDHLDYHLTMEAYFSSKALLFQELKAGSVAVLNLDDPWGPILRQVIPKGVRVLTYSIDDPNADLVAEQVSLSLEGSSFHLRSALFGSGDCTIALQGKFNVYNCLAALGAVFALTEIKVSDCLVALQKLRPAKGRFEVIAHPNPQAPTCIVDYAHTPDGLENALITARGILAPQSKLYVVFGCGGDRDSTKRPLMGKIASELADQIIITSDNPRSEDPNQIIADILAGIPSLKKVKVENDRAKAIGEAIRAAKQGDLVLVAGKGHENYQILADKTIHFDDLEEICRVLDLLAT